MEWVELGRVGSPYGIKGWMHIQSFTDPPEGVLGYPEWGLRIGSATPSVHRVVEGRLQGRGIVARLNGVDDREAAALLRGALIEVRRNALPKPGPREYYRTDLVGCVVRNLDGVELGRLEYFVEGVGHALMVVVGEREYWIPAIPEYLRRVDVDGRSVSVDWPADAD